MNLKNLIIRSLSGAIYVALIVLGVTTTEWSFVVFSALFTFLGTREFLKMTKADGPKLNLWVDIIGATTLVGSVGYSYLIQNSTSALIGIAIILLYFLLRLTIQLYNKKESPINSLAFSIFALIYIVVPMLSMGAIYTQSQTLLVLIFIMIWMNDTGAYVIGSKFGQHGRYRLFPRFSPKKSWEGFIGGIFFSVVAAVLMSLFMDNMLSMPLMIGLGFLVSIFATWGDLAESLVKRTVGVKDSGKFMPGHGGILDRIDSLLFVLPATALFLYIYLAI